jgi:hypothetical protein
MIFSMLALDLIRLAFEASLDIFGLGFPLLAQKDR